MRASAAGKRNASGLQRRPLRIVERWHRRQEVLGDLSFGVPQDVLGGPLLHNAAAIHNYALICKMPSHGQVMRDEKIDHPEGAHLADEIVVMNRGRVVEQGPAQNILRYPKTEITQHLLAAMPSLDNAERPPLES